MTAFYSQKGWWKSKTVWTGILSAVAGVLMLFGVPMPVDPETLAGGLLVVVGFFSSLFRVQATETVGLTTNN